MSMPSVPLRRVPRLIVAILLLLVVAVSLTLALVGPTTPGYAGANTPGRLLQALFQQSPTPVPTPVAATCGVRITADTRTATDTVGVRLSNQSAAATVHAITLAWPPENGELVEILFGGRTLWQGAAAGGSATVFPDTSVIMPTIKAGEETGLTLRFSHETTAGQYILLLDMGKSCYALFDSSQTTSQMPTCFATFDRFDVKEQEAILDFTNTTESPLSLRRLLLFWSDNPTTISSVQIGDVTDLISTSGARSPIDIALPPEAGLTLQPEQSSRLALHFDQWAPLVGYTIALQADNCQFVFSNAEPLSECPVRQEGDLQVVDQSAGLILQNLGEVSQAIERIWLSFPATNGALVDVRLDDASVIDTQNGLFPKSTSPASMTAGVDLLSDISLSPNRRAALSFVFENIAAPEHYALQVDLPNDCPVLTTTRTEETVPCQMEIEGASPLRTDDNRLFLAIRNAGDVSAELQAVQVDWATQFNGALTQVAISGTPFWVGERGEGTATVTHNTESAVPAVAAGQSVEVEFTFANTVVEAPYVFRLEFAEGCRLTYATQPDLAMPTPIEVYGAIEQLPPDAFDGVWQIGAAGGNVLSMQVTPQTVVQPQGLAPLVHDFVRARVLQTGEDEYLATHIRILPNLVRPIQLTGIIDNVYSDSFGTHIMVQSTRVDITQDTVVDGDLVVGYFAEVEGYQRADESVLAATVRATPPPQQVRRVDFDGFVAGWQQVSADEAHWTISQMRVIVTPSTILHGIAWGEPPEIGEVVRVAGNMTGARTVVGLELWYGPGADIQEFSGVIKQLPDVPDGDSLVGEWIIEDSAAGAACDVVANPAAEACKHVFVSESTFVDVSEASPVVGARVQVRAEKDRDGSLHGIWIKALAQ
ncbi:MAG: DUF5666 domain-containing protein [Anaerolineae bacterium]